VSTGVTGTLMPPFRPAEGIFEPSGAFPDLTSGSHRDVQLDGYAEAGR
jgi:hypothetical protein